MAVHHAAKDQMRGSNRRVQRIGNQVGKGKGLEPLPAEDGRQRMQKDREAERLDPREYGLEERIVEVATFDIRAHVNTTHARELARSVEFVNGAVGIEHG